MRPEKNHRGWRWPSTTSVIFHALGPSGENTCAYYSLYLVMYHLFHILKFLKKQKETHLKAHYSQCFEIL